MAYALFTTSYCRSTIEQLLDGIARKSHILTMPEQQPE